MRTRLVIAFIVVALLSALAASWFHTLIQAYSLPAWLDAVILGPGWLRSLVHSRSRAASTPPGAPYRSGLLRGGGWVAARDDHRRCRRRVPAGSCCRSGGWPGPRQRMSGGDLSVRIQPRGRDELAQLVTSFNGMASALEGKVGELEQMEARARQFAGDVSHELRTPLTAMTAVADILHEHPGLTGDAATAARLVRQEVLHLNRLVEDLIEISRFDAGTAQLVTDETDVATAVGRCLRARGWSSVATDVPGRADGAAGPPPLRRHRGQPGRQRPASWRARR